MNTTIQDRAALATEVAEDCDMLASTWTHRNPLPGTSEEVRVYLRRTNAARTEAGYIRLWTNGGGKGCSEYVQGARYGKGSHTAAREGREAYAAYRRVLQERRQPKPAA